MIKIYTTPNCHYCRLAKEYFNSKNLKYEEVGLVGNEQAQHLVISKTGMVVAPIIEINGKFIVGFDRAKINQILTIK